MFGKEKAQAKLLNNLEEHFLKVHRAHQLPVGDFPDVSKFRGSMEGHDISKFPKLDTRLIETMDTVLSRDLPKLLAMFPQEGSHTPTEGRMTQAIAHVGANLAVAPPPPQQQIGYNAPPPPPPGPPGYPQPPPPMPPQTYQQPYPEAAARTVALRQPGTSAGVVALRRACRRTRLGRQRRGQGAVRRDLRLTQSHQGAGLGYGCAARTRALQSARRHPSPGVEPLRHRPRRLPRPRRVCRRDAPCARVDQRQADAADAATQPRPAVQAVRAESMRRSFGRCSGAHHAA